VGELWAGRDGRTDARSSVAEPSASLRPVCSRDAARR
jgi:hypothetical protein